MEALVGTSCIAHFIIHKTPAVKYCTARLYFLCNCYPPGLLSTTNAEAGMASLALCAMLKSAFHTGRNVVARKHDFWVCRVGVEQSLGGGTIILCGQGGLGICP